MTEGDSHVWTLGGALVDLSEWVEQEEQRAMALDRGRFTFAVPRGTAGPIEGIALVTIDNMAISGLAYYTRQTSPVTTFEQRIAITRYETIDPIPFSHISQRLPAAVRVHFARFAAGGARLRRLSPATWREVVRVLQSSSQEARGILSGLAGPRSLPNWLRYPEVYAPIAFERDAIGISLSATGMTRDQLAEWVPPRRPAPFLHGLREAHVREDAMIVFDRDHFAGWTPLRDSLVGEVTYTSEVGQVTVFVANRTPVEQVLGVDLIYYHHDYRAYTLVQYKRMDSESGYRPDSDRSLESEVQRMMSVQASCSPSATGLESYRLNAYPFYVKLCVPRLPVGQSGLVQGMYLHLDHFQLLLNSSTATGPRGGRVLTYDNVVRYLTNTQFIELVQGGWIGSRDVSTTDITELVRTALDSGRSVVAAVGRRQSRASTGR